MPEFMIDFLRSLFEPMPTSSSVHDLTSDADWEAAVERSHEAPVLIFKHSSACPVSSRANRQMNKLAEDGDPPVYRVIVQEARDVSSAIAARLGIQHETPQAILLKDGEPVFDASHYSITAESIRDVVRETL